VRRVAFVVSEHRDGLTPARVARFARARKRLAEVAAAEVDAIHYADVDRLDADATVLSGSYDPWALHDARALARLGEALLAYDGPVLGICAGMQILVRAAGGTIRQARQPAEPGFAAVEVVDADGVLAGLPRRIDVYEEHTDEVTVLPDSLRIIARSEGCAVEAIAAVDRPWWGTQFHPEKWTKAQPAGRAILASYFTLAGIPLRDQSSV
jgi:GMP synthase-like glutamine amidotransferase